MFEKLATFAYSNRRRVLFLAVLGAVIAGAFGAGVSSRLSPYGADDPATQSVQATNRFQAATGRQIDPGVIALVSSGDVRSPAAQQRVDSVAAELKAQPDVARVASFYTTHNPAMVVVNRPGVRGDSWPWKIKDGVHANRPHSREADDASVFA